MRLFIRQKVFSWRDRFYILDESGAPRYAAEGEFLSWGRRLHVYDAAGGEAAFLQQKVWSFLSRYFIFIGGIQAAEVVREFTLFRPFYRVDGPGWEVEGDFWAHEYRITQGAREVARIHKQWMTWGDCYELDVADPADETLALAVVLVIDCVTADGSSSAAH